MLHYPLDSPIDFTIGSEEDLTIYQDQATRSEVNTTFVKMKGSSHRNHHELPSNHTTKQDEHGPVEDEGHVPSSSSEEESDDDIPVFLTCDRCNQVFGCYNDAYRHEINCTNMRKTSSHTVTEFRDKTTLIQYLIDLGRMVKEKDYIYYIPPSVSDNEREDYSA